VGIAGPVDLSYVILANGHPGLRTSAPVGTRYPHEYLESDTLVCLNEGGTFFNFVVGKPPPGAFLSDLRKWLGPNHEAFAETFLPSASNAPQAAAFQYGFLKTLPSAADTS
jgi:hypothetical protein